MAGRAAGELRSLTVNSWRRGLESSTNLDGEVGAAEAVDEERGIVELELGHDVLLDGGSSCCSKGEDGRGAEGWEVVAEGAVVGTEVVPPDADAVGFVDGDEGGLAAGEHLREAGDAHALGAMKRKSSEPER